MRTGNTALAPRTVGGKLFPCITSWIKRTSRTCTHHRIAAAKATEHYALSIWRKFPSTFALALCVCSSTASAWLIIIKMCNVSDNSHKFNLKHSFVAIERHTARSILRLSDFLTILSLVSSLVDTLPFALEICSLRSRSPSWRVRRS